MYVATEALYDDMIAEDVEDGGAAVGHRVKVYQWNSAFLCTEVANINKDLERRHSKNIFLHSCGFLVERKERTQRMNAVLAQESRDQEF